MGAVDPNAAQRSCIVDFSDIPRAPKDIGVALHNKRYLKGIGVAQDHKAYKIRVELCSKDAHLNSKVSILLLLLLEIKEEGCLQRSKERQSA